MPFSRQTIIHLDSVDSTNNYAAKLLKLSRPEEGTVITASFQSEGKGQRGSVWQSEANENLLMSLICYPHQLDAHHQFYLSKCVAVALAEYIEDAIDDDVHVKWPNDIYVANQKIAGILIECQWQENRLQSAIVGIGINLNQTQFELVNATSLRALTGNEFRISEEVRRVVRYIEKYYIKLLSGQFSLLDKLYRERLFRLGQPSHFIYRDEPLEATIIGVDATGQLRLNTKGGQSLLCDIKEISFVI
jgi:BirA family biotin operon repressor/biotin-[acetyl-CoA-carboxylase] ligase